MVPAPVMVTARAVEKVPEESKVPALKVRPPAVAPRLASTPADSLPAVRNVPPV